MLVATARLAVLLPAARLRYSKLTNCLSCRRIALQTTKPTSYRTWPGICIQHFLSDGAYRETQSLTPSIFEYVRQYGRTYHRYMAGGKTWKQL